MLSIKVVYSLENSNKIKEILNISKVNPIFEIYDEQYTKDLKKAYKYKGAAGARESPFIGVYDNNKLIKAFYSEDNSANDSTFLKWFDEYINTNSKKGYIKVTKLEGSNNEKYKPGATHEGNTFNFIEGVGAFISTGDTWFHTSIIKDIDWENKIFHTLNSTYKFEFNEAKQN